ncbi:MAG: hypothetical protein U0V72_13935 [Cytophagales bacterium]
MKSKIIYPFLLGILVFWGACNNSKNENKYKNVSDLEKYDSLVTTVIKNNMCGVDAQFTGKFCWQLEFNCDDFDESYFFQVVNNKVADFTNLLVISINSRVQNLPNINNKKFGSLILVSGIDSLRFDSSLNYFSNVVSLKINNSQRPLQYLEISSKNKLQDLTIINSDIIDLHTFVDSISNVKVLNLTNNKIKHIGKLPFSTETKIFLVGNPILDTTAIKELNPHLRFYF